MHNPVERRPAPAAVLFDLDGVLIDTESQYDVFWRQTGERYCPDTPRLDRLVKGITLAGILDRHFSHLPESTRKEIETASHRFDLQLEMIPIPGAFPFLRALKQRNVKMGLVTSSGDAKLDLVFRTLPLRELFDVVVSADRITEGKPHPMCYLLAAAELAVSPAQCVVFEDSAHGLAAARAAAMRVIGLTTTLPEADVRACTPETIANFSDTDAVMRLLF